MAALVAQLAAITAGTNGAAYTPAMVARVAEFTTALAPRDSSLGGPLYYVRPAEELRKLGPDTCDIAGDLEVFLLIAKRFVEPTQRPSSGRSDEWGKVQAEMAADAAFVLFQHPFAGVQNAQLVDDSVRFDYDDQWVAGWTAVMVRFVVRYVYSRPNFATDNR